MQGLSVEGSEVHLYSRCLVSSCLEKTKHHLSFDHDVMMMMEQNLEQEAASSENLHSTHATHFYNIKKKKVNSSIMMCPLSLLRSFPRCTFYR